MNVKQTAKKITAVVTGAALFTGLSVSGAAALDLSDYPEPFVVDGAFNGKIVVGADAQPSDIVGAIDLSASLQREATTPVSGGETVSVEGGVELEDVYLNEDFGNEEFDDSDLAGFQSFTFRHDGENYDAVETLWINDSALEVVTSIGNEEYEDYGVNSYLNLLDREMLQYRYVFEDEFNASWASEDDPLEIEFLGQSMEITELNDSSSSMTLKVASNSGSLADGDEWEVEGNTVEVIRIHENGVIIEVDGVRKNLDRDAEEEDVEDLSITVKDHIWIDGEPEFNMVELEAGEDIFTSVSKEEAMVAFGEPDDDVDAEWVWNWEVDASDNILWIGAMNNQERKDVEVEYDDERPAIGYGESIFLPNDYASINFDGYYDVDTSDITMTFASTRLVNSYSDERENDAREYLRLTSSGDRSAFNIEDNRYDEAFIVAIGGNSSGYFFHMGYNDDGDREILMNSSNEEVEVDNFYIQLARGGDDVNVTPEDNETIRFEFGNGETLDFKVNISEEHFGSESGETESGDIEYKYGGSDRSLHNVEYGVKLGFGVSFEDPEGMLEDDRFTMTVPHERAEAIVTVSGSETTRAVTGTDGAYTVNPLGTGIAILDTEASLGSEPYLVVGGPVVNTVAAELLGNPTQEEIQELFPEDSAMIRLYADQNAVLVAGHGSQDTVRASYVLANYRDYDLTGTGVDLVTSDATDIEVTPVN